MPPLQILTAPANSGRALLGRTLPSLLEEAAERNPNPAALNERVEGGWRSLSTGDLLRRSEALALGLRDAGLEPGDRVALLTYSDISFCLGDMACHMAGLVTVPIYLTHAQRAVRHILDESGARALLVSDAPLLARALELTAAAPEVTLVAVAHDPAAGGGPAVSGAAAVGGGPAAGGAAAVGGGPAAGGAAAVAHGPAAGGAPAVAVTSFEALERRGSDLERAAPGAGRELRAGQAAEDVATILYTSGTTGLPKGVLLTHQNISSNVTASLSGLTTFRRGPAEIVLSFLPLTHIFARTLQYGVMWYGSTVYFGDPSSLASDLRDVRPTFFASVPRVVEKAFDRIVAAGGELSGARRALFARALERARAYEVERPPRGGSALELRLLDALVYRRWREALGGRLRTVIVGGAALRAELSRVFKAAGIDVLQGYGLTETSPVIAFNRPDRHRPGTVGPVLAGTEAAVADDGEVLARGPHVMLGYHRRPDLTAEALDADGWFHTGDLGAVDADGYLRITGRIKHLFKLSTGKYVMPRPIEHRLEADPLVAAALVLGEGEKYCTALVFAARDALEARTGVRAVDALADRGVRAAMRDAVAAGNRDMPDWSCVKRFALLADDLTADSGALTPKLSVRREVVLRQYADVVDAIYRVGPGDEPVLGADGSVRAYVVEVSSAPRRE